MRQPFSTDGARLEAFSDGVLAVIITIMVLDLKPPHETDVASLRAVVPTFAAYVLSFVFVGIYWNNHHHMMRASKGIDGRAMWANLYLLFWLSLVPFTTSWAGEHPSAAVPTALYGVVLLMSAVAYSLLQASLVALNGPETPFARAVASDRKGKYSPFACAIAIALAFVAPAISDVVYAAVAIAWFVPDRRFERAIAVEEER